MPPPLPRRALFLALAAAGLAACGRRGALEAPPGGKALPEHPDEDRPAPTAGPPATAEVRPGRGRAIRVQVPRDKFILDPLL